MLMLLCLSFVNGKDYVNFGLPSVLIRLRCDLMLILLLLWLLVKADFVHPSK